MELLEDEYQWKQFLRQHGYVLRHQIGYGSFGDVFCVTTAPHNSVSIKYALKRLVTKRNILDDEYIMMEIHSLLQLQHQNIVSLHEVFMTKTVACIVMELAPFGNLDMFFKNSETKVTKIFITSSFTQILHAIKYCHGLWLAHRDINPTNVLVYDSCLVKLADFGLCFQCREGVSKETILCTDFLGQENYLAPEVKNCEPFHAMSADVWSLGCLLRYLTTSSQCFNLDRSICDIHFNKNATENANNVFIKNVDNHVYTEIDSDVNSVEQNYQVNENVDKQTNEELIMCFIRTLCRHSPKERPSAKEASQRWHHILEVMKRHKNDNDPKITRSNKEE